MIARDYAVVDVFTDAPLEGNPVAVFTNAAGMDAELMQRVARELNLSETVFVLADDEADARVRIFTPTVELPFAGHPVLGTAILLGTDRDLQTVTLRTGVGVVSIVVSFGCDERPATGEMEQPIPTWAPLDCAGALLVALGVQESGLPVEVYDNGPRHAFVELAGAAAVAALAPDLTALVALGEMGVNCFAMTDGEAAGDGPARIKTRMFGPSLGVAEDPATGSAAGPLAVHLARHGRIAFGDEVEIHQGAEIGRPSLLRARADGAGDEVRRVTVGGGSVIVARGEYRIG